MTDEGRGEGPAPPIRLGSLEVIEIRAFGRQGVSSAQIYSLIYSFP